MQPRLRPETENPAATKALLALSAHVAQCGLERSLLELVKLRASQINACAFCIHMHARDTLAAGESAERLVLLDAWRESPLFSERERAALRWTEALTLVAETHAPDADYVEMSRHFSPAERVALTLAICLINSWNRMAVGFRYIHPVPPKN